MLEKYQKKIEALMKEVNKVIIGQGHVIKQVLISLLCNSNALMEGYPGLAKTLTIRTMSKAMDLSFSRIQGTPDLMPSDITGTYIIEESRGKRDFKFQKGPIFANMVLVDEINRATPKTQSALLESMQEKQVTVGNNTLKLDKPFFVLATQNPIEQEGTYPLPEAQQDRFLLKIKVGYPTFEDEVGIVDRFTGDKVVDEPKKVFDKNTLIEMQKLVRQVPISNDLKKKVVKVVGMTRTNKKIVEYGASPRASMSIVMASKALALISGKKYVSSQDIIDVSYPVLRHRIILNFEAERQGLTTDQAITNILKKVV